MEPADRLSSWKEISTYLGVDERTCQRWEKGLGLPVMRLDSSAKSRVFASKVEIDAWMARVSSKNGSPQGGNGASGHRGFLMWIRRNRLRRNLMKASVATGAVVCVAVLLLLLAPRDRVPADFRIDGSFLVITNTAGRELWRKDTGLTELASEAKYRQHFQKRRLFADRDTLTHPLLIIGDLDGDGRKETLFAPVNEVGTLNGKLILYDEEGRERWAFDSGTEVVMGRRRYPPDFFIDGFEAEDLDGDGRKEIILSSHARIESPTRILVLRLDKTIRGEYWNDGQISDFILFDHDRDGRPEILCSGQNNGYERPCLFLLDPRHLSGASPQDEKSRFEGKDPGSELFYVLLPVSSLAKLKGPGQAAFPIDVASSGSFSTITRFDYLKFDFGPDLKMLAPVVSHSFRRAYADALDKGAKLPPLDVERLTAELTAGILYYDGKTQTWVNRWARSNPR